MNWLIAWALGAALMTLAVLAIRALLKGKLSLRARYALWLIVAVRLLTPMQLPFSLPVSLPVLPDSSEVITTVLVQGTAGIFSVEQADVFAPAVPGTTDYDSAVVYTVPSDGQGSSLVTALLGMARGLSGAAALTALWALGAAVVLGAVAVSNWRFSRKLRRVCRPLEVEGCPLPVYVASFLPSPCLAGLFWPAIYLTPEAAADETVLRHVLAHELTHYAHRDHLWGLVRCLCLALHWYNPLVWLAAALSKRDGELACDEGAVERLGEAERIPYGKTLVGLVARRSAPADLLSCSTAMTGSGRTVRQRIELLVKQPHTVKTALFAAVSVLALCLICAFAGGEAPAEDIPDMNELALRLVLLDPAYGGMDREELAELLKPAVVLTQTDGDRTLLLVQYPGLAHADGFDDLAAGVWDSETEAFLTGPYTLRGDEAHYTAWTEDTGALYLLCTNSVTYTGLETSTAPLWLRFRDGELTRLTALPAIARTTSAGEGLPGDDIFFDSESDYWLDHKLLPGEGGFTLYERVADQTAVPQDQWGEVGFVPLTILVPGEENVAISGAWSVSQTFSPDPAAADSWHADFRAVVTGLGDGGAELTVEGDPGALTELGIQSYGLYFTGYGYYEEAEPGISWEKDPTFAALNDLALRGITEDVQEEAAQLISVTRNGQKVPGTFRGHTMEGEASFSFDFDEPQSLEAGDKLVVEVGREAAPNGPYVWGRTRDFTPDPSGTWETNLRAVVTRQRGALLRATLDVSGQPGGIETFFIDSEHVTFTLAGWSGALAGYGEAIENLCQVPAPGDTGALAPWFRVTKDGWPVPGRGSFDRTNGVFTYTFDQPLALPYVGDQAAVEIGADGRNLLSAEWIRVLLANLPENAFDDGTAEIPNVDSPQLVFALKTAAARLESADGLKENEFWKLYGSGGDISSIWLDPLCGEGQDDCVLVGVRRDVQDPYSVYAVRDEAFHWLVRKAFRREGEVDAAMLNRVGGSLDAKLLELCQEANRDGSQAGFYYGRAAELRKLAEYRTGAGTAYLYALDLALTCQYPERITLAGGNWVDDQGRLRNNYHVAYMAIWEEDGAVFKTAYLAGDELDAPYGAPEACREAVFRALDRVQAGQLPGGAPMRMTFASGAGGWSTELTLQADGSFTGEYRDDDMGERTAYVCTFHGKFGDIRKVTAASWSMTLEELTLDTGRPVGAEWTEGGIRYVSSAPYGFDRQKEEGPLEPGAKFMFYTPDARGHAPGTELYGMEEFWSWWPDRHAFAGTADTLGCYGLCAVETERGFFTGWYD